MSAMPAGSSPLVGSSRTSSSGSPSSAAATPSRCFMPSEYVRNRSPPRVGQVDPLQRPVDRRVVRGRGSGPARAGSPGRTGTGRSPAPRPASRSVATAAGSPGGSPCTVARPRGRPDEAEQHPQRRRLPGAVRAEEAVHLAAADGQVHRVDRGARAEGLGEPLRAHDRRVVMASIVRRRVSPVVGRSTAPGTQIRVRRLRPRVDAPRGRGVLWSARGTTARTGWQRWWILIPAVPLLVVCLGGTHPAGANQGNPPDALGYVLVARRRAQPAAAPPRPAGRGDDRRGRHRGLLRHRPAVRADPVRRADLGLVPGREHAAAPGGAVAGRLPGRAARRGRPRARAQERLGRAAGVGRGHGGGRGRRGRGRLRAGRPGPVRGGRPGRDRPAGGERGAAARWPRTCTTASGTASR